MVVRQSFTPARAAGISVHWLGRGHPATGLSKFRGRYLGNTGIDILCFRFRAPTEPCPIMLYMPNLFRYSESCHFHFLGLALQRLVIIWFLRARSQA